SRPQTILTSATARNMPARYSSSTYNRLLLSAAASGNPTPPTQTTNSSVTEWFWNKFTPSPKEKTRESATSSLARHVDSADDSSLTTVSEDGDRSSIKSREDAGMKKPMSPGLSSKFDRSAPLQPRKSTPVVLATPVDEESLMESLAE